ncbi:MAG: glutamate-5-semialdehyde dehydrogenase [Eubacteriales bacterium]|nr:glutamate-5-semialdehyde dehydrogenase [Eubacteriales bacterium]
MDMQSIRDCCEAAKEASRRTALLDTETKRNVLRLCARKLILHTEDILSANRRDCDLAEDAGMSGGLLDRLSLSEARIAAMAEGLHAVAALPDPVGRELERIVRPNGLVIRKTAVPFGVIGIIYEARPNVTSDAFGLCFMAGSACVLKGGSAAAASNAAIMDAIHEGLLEAGIEKEAAVLIRQTDRESTTELMRMNGLIDVLIPRGSAALIRSVVEHATVPVIETGSGNCHVYADETADTDMAVRIILNAKTQRVGVCNACESVLIHEKKAPELIPLIAAGLETYGVQVFADDAARAIWPKWSKATEEDWGREYLDYKLSLKLVKDIDTAISHINRYNTGHSETIVTSDPVNAARFQQEVDAACVYVNASTRFTDGGEFGFGAEIGISTQKLHARGPMGLRELCSYKYMIDGTGQIRP